MSQTRTLAVTPTTFDLLSRNIRFLNLDLLIDWPGLNQDTFAFKDDIRAKSKARFKCAEWLLFRLFELWDPQVTKAVRAQLVLLLLILNEPSLVGGLACDIS